MPFVAAFHRTLVASIISPHTVPYARVSVRTLSCAATLLAVHLLDDNSFLLDGLSPDIFLKYLSAVLTSFFLSVVAKSQPCW